MADSDETAPLNEPLPPAGTPQPDRIGPYHILGIIGEGGFGVVYEAEQTEPVRRRVAIKVIKPGMDSQAVVARFEAERQALAVMDHPCIAKIFDGGMTGPELGSRPYFVMELVRGVPITEHCDTQQLTIDERCKLFIKVCEAVQHAHTKGVVHRDLKPSNVLVAYDAEGNAAPKVIDFGVAKALNTRLTEKTIFTDRGQLIGTPEYMSPEQAEMSGQDIDTRADVYSLGVLLYELLTGVLPFDPMKLRSAAFAEIQRIIRETDPPKPSTRLSTMLSAGDTDESKLAIIRARKADARAIAGLLKRDLDWVTMRCLEKDRNRRYESARELAEDLGRYVRTEPLVAGPPSFGYKASKLLRRRRSELAVASVVIVLGAAGLVGTLSGWFSATTAEASERRVLRELEQIGEVLEANRDRIDAEAARFNDIESEHTQILKAFEDDPAAEFDHRIELLKQANKSGDYRRMEWHATRALDLVEQNDHADLDDALSALSGLSLSLRGQGLYAEAMRYANRTLQVAMKSGKPGSVDSARYNRANILRDMHHFDEAIDEYESVLAFRKETFGEASEKAFRVSASLAYALADSGDAIEAMRIVEAALDLCESMPDKPREKWLRLALIYALIEADQPDRAESIAAALQSDIGADRTSFSAWLLWYRARANLKLKYWAKAERLCGMAIDHRLHSSSRGGIRVVELLVSQAKCHIQLGSNQPAKLLLSQADAEAVHLLVRTPSSSPDREQLQYFREQTQYMLTQIAITPQ